MSRKAGRSYLTDISIYLSELELPTPRSTDYSNHDLRGGTKSSHKVICKVGDLYMLKSMPLDILYEIFGHLHPLDILHLTRTSRRLREILLSRSSVSVWRFALSNIEGLPFCPSDLTEPQYTNLVFDRHCHFCLASDVQDVFWACRVRSCKNCISRYFVSEYVLEQIFPEIRNISECETIFPHIIYPKPHRGNPGRILYYLPVAAAFIREFEEVACEPGGALTQWSKEKAIRQAQRLQHASLCETWSTHWALYRRPQEFNLAICILLTALLVFLWRDKFM